MPENTNFNKANHLIWPEWKIESLIGEGSFGKVYKAKREEFGETYYSAIKVISIPQNESELKTARSEGMDENSVKTYFKGFVTDWLKEIKLMESLKATQNIVSIEDYKVTERTDSIGWDITIRMELLTSLNDYIAENQVTKRQIIKMGIDLCKALELCQKLNIVHRDIKPENVFVSKFGEFKLGDFGIARQIERTSSGLSKKGTFTYMAPEVYKGAAYNSTVDIYSLGIVLYRFLNNNRTPFLPAYPQPIAFSDREQSNTKRMTGEAIPKPANADGRLAEIVLRACAFKPKERYDRPTEMREALEAILYTESEAVLIYPAGDALHNSSLKSAGGTIVDLDKNETKLNGGADEENTGDKTESIFNAFSGIAITSTNGEENSAKSDEPANNEKTESIFGNTQGLYPESTSVSPFNMTGGYTKQGENSSVPVNTQNGLPVNGQSSQQLDAENNYQVFSTNKNNGAKALTEKPSKKIWVAISTVVSLLLVFGVFIAVKNSQLSLAGSQGTSENANESSLNENISDANSSYEEIVVDYSSENTEANSLYTDPKPTPTQAKPTTPTQTTPNQIMPPQTTPPKTTPTQTTPNQITPTQTTPPQTRPPQTTPPQTTPPQTTPPQTTPPQTTPPQTAKVGDILYFGNYEQDNNTSNGKEPVAWRVLAIEGGKVLLISEKILDCKPYNDKPYNDYQEAVTWETCTLRSWLNSTFYNSAFTSTEKAKIQTTIVVNSDNSFYGTEGGNNTQDKVFLLSMDEAERYFSSDDERGAKGTNYSINRGLYISDFGNSFWWLRTPGDISTCACHVISRGSIWGNNLATLYDVGARPALWINLSS